ncbi:MAG: amphi-Trp domain-containing protein [Desulfovermiculus sp.]
MGWETKLFKSEERKVRSDVSAFLHQLADKVGAGQVSLRQGQEKITVEMPQNVTLELQVEDEDKGIKGTQHSLKIEIKWFDQDDQGDSGGAVQLE